MWGVAAVVITVTAVGGGQRCVRVGLRIAAGLPAALGALTALTGARTAVIWFKVCPVLLAGSAILLLAAAST